MNPLDGLAYWQAEKERVASLTEQQAMEAYDCDSKADALESIDEEIGYYRKKAEEAAKPTRWELEAQGERYGWDFY